MFERRNEPVLLFESTALRAACSCSITYSVPAYLYDGLLEIDESLINI